MNINFKVLKKKHTTIFKKLFNSLFILQKKNNWFLWQSFDHYLKDFFVLGAFKNKKLIGTFGLQKKYDKEIKHVYMGHWPAVDQKYRSHGIFSKLASLVLKKRKINLLYNCFPVKSFGSIKKALDLNSKKISEFQIDIQTYNQQNSLINFKISKDFSKIRTHKSFKKKFQTFDYNNNYRKWRYTRNPIYKYSIFYVSNSEFLIFKNFQNEKNYIDVLEISVNLENPQRYKKIVMLFLTFIKKNYDKSIVNLWSIEEKNFNNLLLSLGFKKIKSQHIFGYKFFNNTTIKKKWMIQKNDTQKF